MCILYNQRDPTYTMFFIIISALHVSGGFSAHHQEPIKLYVQPWVLSCFPAVCRWCGWVGTLSNFPPIIRRNNCIYATLGICHSVWMTAWYMQGGSWLYLQDYTIMYGQQNIKKRVRSFDGET
jgi:hypothetical protein